MKTRKARKIIIRYAAKGAMWGENFSLYWYRDVVNKVIAREQMGIAKDWEMTRW